MRNQYKSNKTFGYGIPESFNACVGQNGYINIYDYQFGYQTAVKLLIDSIKKDSGLVDPLIYPLLFSARHCIELFLKRSIHLLEGINKMINENILFKNHLLIHDISVLWNYFKSLSTFDKRISEQVNLLDEYVCDYYDVDLTGETFRYPFDTNNRHHLDDFSVINVLKFEKRYYEMIEIIEIINSLLDFLYIEYNTGTFSSGLSRSEIEQISKKLPQKTEWMHESFDDISNKIKNEYNITSNKKYSKILNLIKNHKEFSFNIGIINVSTKLTKDDYDFYKKEYINSRDGKPPQGIKETDLNKIMKSYKRSIYRGKIKKIFNKVTVLFFGKSIKYKKPYLERKNEFIDIIMNKLSLESIASLCAFYDIGRDKLYSETYEKAYNYYSSKEKYDLIFTHLSDGYKRIEDIEKGIKKCGQIHLL